MLRKSWIACRDFIEPNKTCAIELIFWVKRFSLTSVRTLRYFTTTFTNIQRKYCHFAGGCWNLYSLSLSICQITRLLFTRLYGCKWNASVVKAYFCWITNHRISLKAPLFCKPDHHSEHNLTERNGRKKLMFFTSVSSI